MDYSPMCSIWHWYNTWIPMASSFICGLPWNIWQKDVIICCATLSRLFVLLLYRWRSGQTFTPGFSKDVKFVRAFLFLQNEPIKRKMFVFVSGKSRYQWVFHFEADPFLRFLQGHDANTTEPGGIQRSTQRLRRSHRVATCFAAAQRLGVKVEKPQCCFTMFFFRVFLFNV